MNVKELPLEIKNWPRDAKMDFEERAGIMEYESGMTREEAEKKAEWLVRARFKGMKYV